MWSSHRARWLSVLSVVGLMAVPALLDADDFPLSTYPMYSSTRSREVSLVTAQGIEPDGRPMALGLETIGSTDDPLIAAGELRAAIGAGTADARCREIAARLGPDSTAEWIEIVTERHDAVDQTLGRPSLVERTIHATCPTGSSP